MKTQSRKEVSDYELLFQHEDKKFREAAQENSKHFNPINAAKGIIEFEKNEFEKIAILNCIYVFNWFINFLEINKEFNPSFDLFHILTKEEYQRFVNVSNSESTFSYGNVYLIRNSTKVKFLQGLIHEMSHMVSFQKYLIELPKGTETKLNLYSRRCGYATSFKDGHQIFSGFNEGFTEMFSFNIKLLLVEMVDFLTPVEKNELIQVCVYLDQIAVINFLITKHFGKEKVDIVQRILTCNYITGDYSSIDLLGLSKKDYQVFMNMGTSEEDGEKAIEYFNIV